MFISFLFFPFNITTDNASGGFHYFVSPHRSNGNYRCYYNQGPYKKNIFAFHILNHTLKCATASYKLGSFDKLSFGKVLNLDFCSACILKMDVYSRMNEQQRMENTAGSNSISPIRFPVRLISSSY